ncbi:hypothetical protein ACMFMF_006478 [Clarireedia jacksonii]
MVIVSGWRTGLLEKFKTTSASNTPISDIESSLEKKPEELRRQRSGHSCKQKTLNKLERVVIFCSLFC